MPDGMQCGTIEVPLDHADPAKGTTTVAVARLPATEPDRRIGSLLLNFGGPGAPGIEGLADDPRLFADLGERYDVVAFDPRGVAHSDPVTCGRDGSVVPDPNTGTAEGLAALRAEARRCAEASGPVFPYMGTNNVARDMEVLREALGDRKLNFLGFSYGARLGAAYATLFPQRTGRMVLDGIDDHSDSLEDRSLATARARQRALGHFLTWCAHQDDCVYGTNSRTAKEKVADLVERLDKKPLIAEQGPALSGWLASQIIAQALYTTAVWPALADVLAQAEDGDPAGMLRFAGLSGEDEESQDEGPDPVPADNWDAAGGAVNCVDDPDRPFDKATPAAVEKEITALEGKLREASEVFGPPLLDWVLMCYGRPVSTDFLRKVDHPGAPPMLLVGTRGDPATPYEWTEDMAERLGSAVIIDHKGEGHTGYLSSSCVKGYVDHFLIDGKLPSGTRSCPAEE
ncbi:alpha/beta hydrolase [Streptomyces sp. NPDC088762]|uniref:alpha/beta hydrolase n=1 Tax=Streptomyces sp. NPDC088762 TaxID=3365891 RepID=UPI00382CED98